MLPLPCPIAAYSREPERHLCLGRAVRTSYKKDRAARPNLDRRAAQVGKQGGEQAANACPTLCTKKPGQLLLTGLHVDDQLPRLVGLVRFVRGIRRVRFVRRIRIVRGHVDLFGARQRRNHNHACLPYERKIPGLSSGQF